MRQSFHGVPLGVTIVLNSVIPTAPQPQRLPLSVVIFVFDFMAVVHAWIAGT